MNLFSLHQIRSSRACIRLTPFLPVQVLGIGFKPFFPRIVPADYMVFHPTMWCHRSPCETGILALSISSYIDCLPSDACIKILVASCLGRPEKSVKNMSCITFPCETDRHILYQQTPRIRQVRPDPSALHDLVGSNEVFLGHLEAIHYLGFPDF
jgi:hypothetical protein